MSTALNLNAPLGSDDKDILRLIETVKQGIRYSVFAALVSKSPFNLSEWSSFLHLSERTMQRYKKEKKTFDPLHAEKILEITLLYKLGVRAFGDKAKFHTWLESESVALGGVKPKTLLDTTFGINMLRDALERIEHGVLA